MGNIVTELKTLLTEILRIRKVKDTIHVTSYQSNSLSQDKFPSFHISITAYFKYIKMMQNY